MSVRTAVMTCVSVMGRLLRSGRFWLFVSAFSLALCADTIAADDNRVFYPGGSSKPSAPSSSGTGMANALSLMVALAIAGFGGWIFWRNRKTQAGAGGLNALKVEETKSLGNRQYLVVASYQNRKFLLGVCPGRIDMLSPLDEDAKEKRE